MTGSRLRSTDGQVGKKLRRRGDAGDQQAIAGAGAGDIKHMALRVVDLFEVGLIGDGLDPLFKRQHTVIARHDSDAAKLKTLGQVHGADRYLARGRGSVFAKLDVIRSEERRVG